MNDSVSRFSKYLQTTSVNIQVPKPSSICSNYDRSKGGRWVTLQSNKVLGGMDESTNTGFYTNNTKYHIRRSL